MIEFTEPKIIHYGYNVDKDWYIYFRARNPVTGERKLFRYKKGINRFKTKKERIREARELCEAYKILLKDHQFNPFLLKNEQKAHFLCDLLQEMLNIKQSSLKIKTIRTYQDFINIFTGWLKSKGWHRITADKFTRRDAIDYADYLLKTRKYSGKSFNNNIGAIKTMFNALINREYISASPFKGIAKLPEASIMNVPYTEQEREKIVTFLKAHKPRLYYAISFVYFCFIRRSELIRLRVRDINLVDHTITIPAGVSKNRKQESVTIPTALDSILHDMELGRYDPNFYVFGHKFQTCARKIIKADSLSLSMKRVNTRLEIKGNKGFYSWKHSGAIALYKATKDPYIVSRQCRHSELKTTMIYLRSLGLTVDYNIRRAKFSF